MKTSGKDVYYIEVVGRALDVLEVFVHEQKPQLSLKEIADRLDQRMNSVFRLLYTLAKHGYVIKKDKQYELGSKLIDLTSAKMRHTDLVSLARPYMDALLARFRETVNLGVMMEGTIRYVEVRESLERFRLAEHVGGTDPLHCTALGKAHLAYLPYTQVRELLKIYGMPRVTEHTLETLSALRADLEKTRERGYAIDDQESMLGAYCVAAPILDLNEHPIAAMSIAAPNVRLNQAHVEVVSVALLEAAAGIAAKLTAAPPPSAKAAIKAAAAKSSLTKSNSLCS
jgi:IclR family transcriptional regulator, KDG regulon repressor